jgi:AcrR family transcriptional regulator
MEAAFELFGKYGFEGTSVRDIAQKADANIAAINYHFKSKEGLYWEIMVQTFADLESEIEKFFSQSKTVTELSLKTFEHFLNEKYALKNAMKMMLMEGIAYPEDPSQLSVLKNPAGPPGGRFFGEAIQREIPYPLSREGLLWGVKSTFGSVFHWGFMCSTPSCLDQGPNPDPLMTVDQVRKDIEFFVGSTLDFLKANEKRFRK